MSTKTNLRRARRHYRPTERDLAVVREIWDAGLATREQVQTLFFSPANRSRAQTRIKLLRDHGYLEQVPGRFPNEPAVYVVSKRAAKLLGLGGPEARTRSWAVSHARLQHSLAIADCRAQVAVAARESGPRLLRWLGEEGLRSITTTSGIVPDAYFQLERNTESGSRTSGFFLEVERTEKSERGLRNKLYGLGSYYYGGGYERDFGTKALRILVLVEPDPGLPGDRFAKRVAGLGRLMGVTLLRVAELQAFLATPPKELFFAPIWLRPGFEQPVALFGNGGAEDGQQAEAA